MQKVKFENVKVGDIVYRQSKIRTGIDNYELFFIPQKVTRITKAQFEVLGMMFHKKDGSKVGAGREWYDTYSVYNLGEKQSFSDKLVKDETEDMKNFELKLKINFEIKAKLLVLVISKVNFYSVSLEAIKAIDENINQINGIIKIEKIPR